MGKALVFGTKDCRFESCQGHEYCSDSRLLTVLLEHNHTQRGDSKERSDPCHCKFTTHVCGRQVPGAIHNCCVCIIAPQ
jgi:hypothetical protein